ncbi:MAG: CRISPR-associated endonuclease Cas1, partial [Fervidicoccus sp.]
MEWSEHNFRGNRARLDGRNTHIYNQRKGIPHRDISDILREEKPAETRRKQYSATTGKSGCTLAKSLVRSKISNQAECLRNLNRYFNDEDVRKEVEKLRENSKRVQELQCSENWSSQLRQIESSAARAYWGSLAVFLPESIGFDGRDVDSGDAFNCSLNYIYALLYS